MTESRPTSSDLVNWARLAVHVSALVLLAWLGWDLFQDRLGPDWVGQLTWRTGRYALVFLLLSLAPTVIVRLTGLRAVIRLRRPLGVYAFVFALLHFLTFIGIDYAFDFRLALRAVLEGRFVLAGLAALVILIPLALTSTRGWMKRLGRNWVRLHRLTYLASALAVLHYAWRFKEFRVMPLLAGIALLLLLAARVVLPRHRRSAAS